MSKALALGFGTVARRVEASRSGTFAAVTRRQADPSGPAVIPYADGEVSDDLKAAMKSAALILVSLPPHRGEDGLIAQIPSDKRIVYLSATSVYGDHHGGWVDERMPPSPASETGRARLQSERLWKEAGAVALRLGGIYGPGQSALDRIGTPPVDKAGLVFNRIHVDDIVSAVFAARDRAAAGDIFNIVDDRPTSPVELHAIAAHVLQRTPLEAEAFGARERSPAFSRFYNENKRVSNARAKAVLGWRPRYRDSEAGLMAIAAEEKRLLLSALARRI
jgi:nucleoside-diphosphate-sugar epimerase